MVPLLCFQVDCVGKKGACARFIVCSGVLLAVQMNQPWGQTGFSRIEIEKSSLRPPVNPTPSLKKTPGKTPLYKQKSPSSKGKAIHHKATIHCSPLHLLCIALYPSSNLCSCLYSLNSSSNTVHLFNPYNPLPTLLTPTTTTHPFTICNPL